MIKETAANKARKARRANIKKLADKMESLTFELSRVRKNLERARMEHASAWADLDDES